MTARAVIIAAVALIARTAAGGSIEAASIFNAGAEGYHTFRIPAIVAAVNGDLVAICEGRRDGQGDSGAIDLVCRRSSDGGGTWSPLQRIASDPAFTTGNPVPIVDRRSGDIVLLATRNHAEDTEARILSSDAAPRTVWFTRSRDNGASWEPLTEISGMVRRLEWRWYATGPGHGIQLRDGILCAPANHSLSPDVSDWHSHVLLSGDGGRTWRVAGIQEGRTNESTIAQLADGRLYQNMRNYRNTYRRAVSFSGDGGETWSAVQDDPALVEPVCQASVLAVDRDGRRILVFSNPASEKRERMAVRVSTDGAQSWSPPAILHAGPAAYSDLVELPGGTLGCLYECGEKSPYEQIAFARFTLDWVESAGASLPRAAE